MKRMLLREMAILLVLALLAPMFSVAEDGSIGLPDGVAVMEEALGLEGVEAVDVEEIEAGEDFSLDALTDELAEGEPQGPDAGAQAKAQSDEAENASKKYGVPTKLTLGVKETFALKCTKKKLTYKSSSAKIAKVDAKGVVTAVKKGKATITVYSGKKKLTTCKVTVVAAPKKVTLDKKSAVLGVKEKLTLMPQISAKSHASFTYTVKNSRIATVSKKGVVTGKKAGKTTVTVATHNGKKATLKLTVKKAPGKVTMSKKTLELEEGQSYTLVATLPKKTASNKLTWTTSNKKVAKVDEKGTVTAVKAGTAKITVATFNNKRAVCTVTVKNIVQPEPTPTPTPTPTEAPTEEPTEAPTPTPTEAPTEALDYSVGSYVTFGHYEQDNDTSNGPEPIEWLVLEKSGDTVTLISRYGLDAKPYHTELMDITWQNCSLRAWLNGAFLSSAFTSAEQAKLQTVTVKAEDNPYYGTEAGNDTQDKVYLLSISEALNLFANDEARKCWSTAYAVARGAWTISNGTCWWWLRSPGYGASFAAIVDLDGIVYDSCMRVYDVVGAVRPVVCLRLS